MTEEKFDVCMQRICTGDKNALKEIYEAYLPYIFSIVMGMLQNRENAEDITSEFFLRLWNHARQYKGGGGHKGYLATIARNMCIDFIRKNKKEMLVNDFDGTYQDEDSSNGSEKSLSVFRSNEEAQSDVEEEVVGEISLQEALQRLHPTEREIINLKIMGDFTFKEIAEILHLPMGTVTWRYQEGIKKLRRCGYE